MGASWKRHFSIPTRPEHSERATVPLKGGAPSTWAAWDGFATELAGSLGTGKGLALVVEELNGPLMIATTVGLVAGAYGLAAAIGSPTAGVIGDRLEQ